MKISFSNLCFAGSRLVLSWFVVSSFAFPHQCISRESAENPPSQVELDQVVSWYNQYSKDKTDPGFVDFMDSVAAYVGKMMQLNGYEDAIKIYSKCIDLAENANDQKVQLKFIVLLGNFYKIKGDFNKSNEILLSGIELEGLEDDKVQQYLLISSNYFQIDLTQSEYYNGEAEKRMGSITDSTTIMLYHNTLAEYYRRTNDLPKAIQEGIEAMKYMGPYPVQKVGSLITLSGYMLTLKNTALADDYLDQASELIDPDKDKRTHAFILMARSKVDFQKKDYQAAIANTEKAYGYFVTTKFKNQQAKCLYFLAGYTRAANDTTKYEMAIAALEKTTSTLDNNEYKVSALITLAENQIAKGDFEKAEMLFNTIDESILPKDYLYKDHLLKIKSKIAANTGDEKLAIHTLEILVAYKDSLESLNTKNILAYHESNYDRTIKEKEISELNTQSIAKSKTIWITSLISIALAALLFLALWFYKKLRIKNRKIFSQAEQLKTILQEKDILLREIHHRVKNNLQVVSSLLNLQSNYILDEVALEAINDGKNRVLSMALIHQNLYSEDLLTSIETKVYFEDLLDQLFDSYNIADDRITLEKDIDSFYVDVDTMIPLGLITNELISNALKHAFNEGMPGKIKFSFKNIRDQIVIQISDNGKGMDLAQFTSSKSFGNKMIMAFVQKLKAEFNIRNENGSQITLTLPNLGLAEVRA